MKKEIKKIKCYWGTSDSFDNLDTVFLVVGTTPGEAKQDYLNMFKGEKIPYLSVRVRRAPQRDFAFQPDFIV